MLRKIISIVFIFLSVALFLYNKKDIEIISKKVDTIISDNKLNSKYDGYIYIPKLNYRNVIKTGNQSEILDKNIVLMMSSKEIINKEIGNIILAGHNNKYVFSIIYNLDINDEIIISDFKNQYSFNVEKTEYINIKDKQVLDNVYDKKILTLITCTNNNQIRYVVTSKLNHIISHN